MAGRPRCRRHGVRERRAHPAGRRVAQAKATIVSGRFSRPDEVADLAVFLAGDRAANILGSDFTVDGGLIPTW
ncbi:SDR family oxidoreductase [Actinacidiphila alni]|uniref:SDR family oxidoreductase n=1 Tax=Actinacidiphila alni TaxID=380248 RepID=UPI0034517D0A